MSSSVEYTALLALVSAGLAGAGVVADPRAVGQGVAGALRTGVCIVGGDVCRASDARAAGLRPCTVEDHTGGEGLTFTVASLRFGADDRWTAARRSDGSVLITHSDERRLGGEVGIGAEASPLGITAEVTGNVDYALTSGRAWEFRDAASAVGFLQNREAVEPTWRFGAAGSVVAVEEELEAWPVTVTQFETSARAAAGARVGRGLTTYYVRTRADALAGGVSLPGLDGRLAGPSTGDAIVELTRDVTGPRELAFRRVQRGAPDQVVETVARLDLRDPGHRAAAEPLLARRLPWAPAVAHDLRVLVARAVRSGIVERAVYEVVDDSDGIELGASLGLSVGVDASEVDVDRRLLAAHAWTQGSRARQRLDCGAAG